MTTSTAFPVWRKSRRSGNGDNCVEVAGSVSNAVAVRDTKDPSGGILSVTTSEWARWTTAIKDGSLVQ